MRVTRFYLPEPLLSEGVEAHLDERCHRHAVQVLRLREGDELVLFNGDGHDYHARLSLVEKRASRARVHTVTANPSESPLAITLVQGVAKGDHMDYSIQKAVELGVSEILPVVTERSILKADEKRLERKLEHWQGVIISACEQCGRSRVPTLGPISRLDAWLAQAPANSFVLDPTAPTPLAADTPRPDACTVLVGPEGGLTEAEVAAARTAGLTPIRLGPRILRTETAASSILTALQWLWGDLNT